MLLMVLTQGCCDSRNALHAWHVHREQQRLLSYWLTSGYAACLTASLTTTDPIILFDSQKLYVACVTVCCSQFSSIVEALNFLRDRSPNSRDGGDVPGRMLVLHHAWYLLNSHPNMKLDGHPADAVKKVRVCVWRMKTSQVWLGLVAGGTVPVEQGTT